MKVLIVGAGSYIGQNFATYAEKKFSINIVDSYNEWEKMDFSGYNVVLFVAGIAHRRQTKENRDLYFQVNRDLAVETAKKAKSAKVKQFVYLSTMAVYGKKEGEISCHTKPKPRHNDYYGQSKFQAELALTGLNDSDFTVSIIRPPMVYGYNCPGKFSQLIKLARILPVVPDNKNKRSILYIDNLSEFLCAVIRKCLGGVWCPQDNEYANTAGLIRSIRLETGKKTLILPGMGWLLRLGMQVYPNLRTAFGTLYYRDTPSLPN